MRQHRERLDQEQRRRHHEVLAGNVEVQLVEQFEPRQILLGDNAGGYFVRVELGALEQMQQEVERALVNREPEADAGVSHEPGRRVRLVAQSCTIQEIAPNAIFITGYIATSSQCVYSSSSSIRKPYRSVCAYTRAAAIGRMLKSTRPPSSGSTGKRLK